MPTNIFMTGASGCVGHYIFDALVANPKHHLYLLVRNPGKLMFDPALFSNVTIIQDELKNISKYAELLSEMNYVIHAAAGWGETEANYNYTLEFFNLLNPLRCQKVLYFSTASLLTEGNRIYEPAGEIGTSYIKGKYWCYKKLSALPICDRIVTLFPTWVLAGDNRHPFSHATLGVKAAVKWLWLLRFFTTDVSFHFIHAQDIALVVKYLLEHETKKKEIVLGNKLVTATQFIAEMCAYFKKKVYFKVPIFTDWVKVLAPLLRIKLSEWDIYCLEKKRFEYAVVNPQSFSVKPVFPTVKDVLDNIKGHRVVGS